MWEGALKNSVVTLWGAQKREAKTRDSPFYSTTNFFRANIFFPSRPTSERTHFALGFIIIIMKHQVNTSPIIHLSPIPSFFGRSKSSYPAYLPPSPPPPPARRLPAAAPFLESALHRTSPLRMKRRGERSSTVEEGLVVRVWVDGLPPPPLSSTIIYLEADNPRMERRRRRRETDRWT